MNKHTVEIMWCPNIALQLLREPIGQKLVVDERKTKDVGEENDSELLIRALMEVSTINHGTFRLSVHHIALNTLLAAHLEEGRIAERGGLCSSRSWELYDNSMPTR